MANQTLKDWREHAAELARRERERPDENRHRFRIELAMVVATILSAIATTAAVVVGVYQYGVARDQLVAADRNRSIQTMIEHVRKTCTLLAEIRIRSEIVQRSNRVAFDENNLEEFVRGIVDDVEAAPAEGRAYFNADEVAKLVLSAEYRVQYAKAYADLSGSIQMTRLWVADRDLAGLEELNYDLAVLQPDSIFTDEGETYKIVAENFGGFYHEFNILQRAWFLCPLFETTIVNWAKGKSMDLPDFQPLPVATKSDAERQVRETGAIKGKPFNPTALFPGLSK